MALLTLWQNKRICANQRKCRLRIRINARIHQVGTKACLLINNHEPFCQRKLLITFPMNYRGLELSVKKHDLNLLWTKPQLYRKNLSLLGSGLCSKYSTFTWLEQQPSSQQTPSQHWLPSNLPHCTELAMLRVSATRPSTAKNISMPKTNYMKKKLLYHVLLFKLFCNDGDFQCEYKIASSRTVHWLTTGWSEFSICN